MLNERQSTALHGNTTVDGRTLTAQEREKLLQPFLPPTPSPSSSTSASPYPSRAPSRRRPINRTRQAQKKPIRTLLKYQLHLLVYTLIQTFFGIYIRLRRVFHAIVDRVFAILYHHHRTPDLIRKDIRNLKQIPEHLSVILQLNTDEERSASIENLISDVGEIAAWSASSGIPVVSIYERTGILKHLVPQTHLAVCRTLQSYFGNTPSSHCPSLSIRAPNQPSFSPPTTPPNSSDAGSPSPNHITILLLSEDDGRNTIVDLTKTLAEMAQRRKLSPDDISAELVDAEISESVMGEPDLLVVFGPRVVLDGYPPWQVRLTEIFHVPDNSEGVGYQVFLRALHRYAKAQMRFGR